jgi:uncharacterized protein (TIGR00369 family)
MTTFEDRDALGESSEVPGAPPERTRTVSWEDPAPIFAAASELTGIELMRAVMDGTLPAPPIAQLMGFTIERVDEGSVVFGMDPIAAHLNPIGSVHGGVIATLLDSAAGCAVHTTMPVGGMYTTLELKVNYLRPVFPGGARLLAEGTVLNRGSTAILVEATITAADTGKKVAHATSTCLVIPPRT